MGVLFNIAFLYIGFLLTTQRLETSQIQLNKDAGELIGLVDSEPVINDKSVKLKVSLEAYRLHSDWYESSGNIILYLERDQNSEILIPGDRIIFSPDLEQYKNAGNPEEFDYQKYLWHHFIQYTDYVKSNEWSLVYQAKDQHLLRISTGIRNRLISIYKKNGLTGDELAVASALTLGNKLSLSDKIRKSYSVSGGMHVLAVSGLHVGIVFFVISSLLFFIRSRKYLWIKTILIVLFIWFYAFITGFSPSVTRATLMFSLFAFGKLMKQNPGFLNILSASALINLVINPLAITEIGFQLSYAAVASIVFFYPRIYSLVYVENKYLDKIWSLIVVSIAAQLGTMPITIFYFHQFSNYFLLTNLLLIPLVSIAIYLAIALLLIASIPFLAHIVGFAFKFTIQIMNKGISLIENLPFSSSVAYISEFQFVILLVFVFSIVMFLEYKRNQWLFTSLTVLLLFFINTLIVGIKHDKQVNFLVYNVRNTSAINFIDGRDNLLVTSLNNKSENQHKYACENYWLKKGLSKEKILYIEDMQAQNLLQTITSIDNPHIFSKFGFIGFYKLKVAIANRNIYLPQNPLNPISVDYLIVSGYYGMSAERIINLFICNKVIIDSSVSKSIAKEISTKLQAEGYSVYNVHESGAFLLSVM